ncbi:hypothetical protein, partial [Enterobacter hormaechei]|uniref:hypothetical protein n=1 Tax=Enterobacter hormaechei TaxID=158836 RepID=UPI0019503A28
FFFLIFVVVFVGLWLYIFSETPLFVSKKPLLNFVIFCGVFFFLFGFFVSFCVVVIFVFFG